MRYPDLGYAREFSFEGHIAGWLADAYAGKWIGVRRAADAQQQATVLARIGELDLVTSSSHRHGTGQWLTCEPLLAARTSGSVGIDGSVLCDEALSSPNLPSGALTAAPHLRLVPHLGAGAGELAGTSSATQPAVGAAQHGLPYASELAPGVRRGAEVAELIGAGRLDRLLADAGGHRGASRSAPVRVAIVDGRFGGYERVENLRQVAAPVPCHLPLPAHVALDPDAGNHGTLMAMAIRAIAPASEAELGLFCVGPVGRDLAPLAVWLGAANLACAIAAAVGQWRADVVLVAMSDSAWGMPRYLSAVLTEAVAACGATIVCSTGDPTSNRCATDAVSAALPADALASHPHVIAVSACDELGRWYRRFSKGAALSQEPLSCFGPAVAVCAPGIYTVLRDAVGEELVDDTSLASALAAAVVARVRVAAPGLDPTDVRSIITATAGAPPRVDDGYGTGAGQFDDFDHRGHNPKLGAGMVDTLCAVLSAIDPVCQALLSSRPHRASIPSLRISTTHPTVSRVMAFFKWTCTEQHPVLVGYRTHGPEIAALMVRCNRTREAAMWLGRHLAAVLGSDLDVLRWRSGSDHAALAWRIDFLGALVAEHPDASAGLRRWCTELRALLASANGRQIADTVANAFDWASLDCRERAIGRRGTADGGRH